MQKQRLSSLLLYEEEEETMVEQGAARKRQPLRAKSLVGMTTRTLLEHLGEDLVIRLQWPRDLSVLEKRVLLQ